jgi:hypothetical protein
MGVHFEMRSVRETPAFLGEFPKFNLSISLDDDLQFIESTVKQGGNLGLIRLLLHFDSLSKLYSNLQKFRNCNQR